MRFITVTGMTAGGRYYMSINVDSIIRFGNQSIVVREGRSRDAKTLEVEQTHSQIVDLLATAPKVGRMHRS